MIAQLKNRKENIKLRSAIVAGLVLAGSLVAHPALAAVDIVASLPELAAIAKAVGGNKVTVTSIAKPGRDYHTIEARPSDVARVKNADLMIRSGASLDAWMDALVNASGNSAFSRGGARFVDASADIPRIEVPNSSISGASGDLHPTGNPHFYYDPVYAKFIARNVTRALVRIDAGSADTYRANYQKFNSEIDRRMAGWKRELAPYAGHNVVTYHRNYAYFLRRFALREYNHMEPKPGIPPSGAHIRELISDMKRDRVKAVVIESIYPTHHPDLLTRQLGIKYYIAPYSVSSLDDDGYFRLLDSIVDSFRKALSS